MSETPSRYLVAARRLLDAHQRRERFGPLPPELAPRTPEEAYLIQDDYVALRSESRGAIVAHKIALSPTPCSASSASTSRRPAPLLKHAAPLSRPW